MKTAIDLSVECSRLYEFPISRTYVKHWGMAEAVRELLQNAIDSDSPFEYTFANDELRITSRFTTLEPRQLLFGNTSKAERSDKIGSFGEGFKLALMVLCRENYPVRVLNGSLEWNPIFRYSDLYGDDMFTIEEYNGSRFNEGLTFVINNLTLEDQEKIRSSCLQMQEDMTATIIETRYGQILRDRPQKLYVGGLFVCDTELEFGYNIKPGHLPLERDRQTVSNFDLLWLTKDMWFDSALANEVAQLIEKKSPDLQYAEYGAPELVKEACYRLFLEKNPGKIAVGSQEELQRLIAGGMTNVVYVHGTYHKAIIESQGFKKEAVRILPKLTPQAELKAFMARNKKIMRKRAIDDMEVLIHKARNWKL